MKHELTLTEALAVATTTDPVAIPLAYWNLEEDVRRFAVVVLPGPTVVSWGLSEDNAKAVAIGFNKDPHTEAQSTEEFQHHAIGMNFRDLWGAANGTR